MTYSQTLNFGVSGTIGSTGHVYILYSYDQQQAVKEMTKS